MKTLAHIEAHIDFPDEDISPDTKAQLLKRSGKWNLRSWTNCCARRTKDRFCVAASARRLSGGRTRANPVCSTNCSATTAPSSRRLPARRATRLRRRRTFAACPSCSLTPPVCAKARDEIEVEGIRRSRETLEKAELILHVLDASEPLTSADENYLAEFAAKKRILVRNKTDLPHEIRFQWWRASSRAETNARQ